jgi:hypothetical protein
MEDFTSARPVEPSENTNGLLSEWQESQISRVTFEQAAGKPGTDCPKAPGKDVADRLDGELRQFASEKRPNASAGMQAFQNLVNKFEDAPDKKAAVKEFGPAASKLKVDMLKDAEATFHKIEEEAAKNPDRKGLDADYSNKVQKFFDKVSALPSKESTRVMQLMEVKAGESLEDRNARVRDGIKNRPALLASFDSMEAARDKVEESKSPTEKELDKQHRRDIDEANVIKQVIRKVSIRADINA